MEEAHLVKTLRLYDLKEVKFRQIKETMIRGQTYFYGDYPRTIIEVPGLADGRPSVLPNDTMYDN